MVSSAANDDFLPVQPLLVGNDEEPAWLAAAFAQPPLTESVAEFVFSQPQLHIRYGSAQATLQSPKYH